MSYLVDGSNLLGRTGHDRESTDSKRALVRLLAQFARAKRTRVTCVFDGRQPDGFACQLGALHVVFSHPRSADAWLIDRLDRDNLTRATLVTSDRTLAMRLKTRRISILTCEEFRRELTAAEREETGSNLQEDWERYFSDPENRNI